MMLNLTKLLAFLTHDDDTLDRITSNKTLDARGRINDLRRQ